MVVMLLVLACAAFAALGTSPPRLYVAMANNILAIVAFVMDWDRETLTLWTYLSSAASCVFIAVGLYARFLGTKSPKPGG